MRTCVRTTPYLPSKLNRLKLGRRAENSDQKNWRSREVYIQVSVRFGIYRFQISSSVDRTAPASGFPLRSDRRHLLRLRRSVAIAVRDDRHRSVGSVPVTFCSLLCACDYSNQGKIPVALQFTVYQQLYTKLLKVYIKFMITIFKSTFIQATLL